MEMELCKFTVTSYPVGRAAIYLDGKYDTVKIDHETTIGFILLSNENWAFQAAID